VVKCYPGGTSIKQPYGEVFKEVGLSFLAYRGASLLLTGGGEILCTDGYCHYHLPAVVHKMDPGILAQQSDVRCKRGRLGVIMLSPAAHTSKGLAKAFVSSAGGKGPENRDTPTPLSCAQSQGESLKLESTTSYLEPQGGEQLQEKVGVNPLYSNKDFGVNLSANSNHFNDLLQCRSNSIPEI
jgi:hypothetical protein